MSMNLMDLSNQDATPSLINDEQLELAMGTDIEDESLYPVEMSQKGFCVKEFEEQLQALKKENFNLKLRIYFLEEKNPNIPMGAELIYKQNIDLKIEKENLLKDSQEKQDLLCQASKAIELLDQEKETAAQRSQMVIDELNQKIESLNHEMATLQNALADKSSLGNDTGYADYLGQVNSKDVECQRLVAELQRAEGQLNLMRDTAKNLQNEKAEIESKVTKLLYDNNSMKDKLANFTMSRSDESKNLETELQDYKNKWAATQCDLQDAEESLKKTELERDNTMKLLKNTIEALKEEKAKSNTLQEQLAEANEPRTTAENKKLLAQKNNEIEKLHRDLNEAKVNMQVMASHELEAKNREIEKLSSLIKSLQSDRNNSMTQATRFSLEQLSDSFNDLKFQQAMEQKKQSQRKIDELMNALADVTHSQTKKHVTELQTQMAIVVEKQEVTDSALEKCADLCGVTLNHLHELANFLSALLQQKEIRESLSEMTMFNIQSAIDKTMEFSNQAGRYSVEGRFSSLFNGSSLDLLMSAARQSIANIQEIQIFNKSIQASSGPDHEAELEAAKKELEDVNRVNQVLEDEIISLKESAKKLEETLAKRDDEIEKQKIAIESLTNDAVAAQDLISQLRTNGLHLLDANETIDELNARISKLEHLLQQQTIKKIEFEDQNRASEKLASSLTLKLATLQSEMEKNWIPRCDHDAIVNKFESDIKRKEAEIIEIWSEFDDVRKCKTEENIVVSSTYATALESAEAKDEAKPSRRTLEISEDRKALLNSSPSVQEVVLATSMKNPIDRTVCSMCPTYQAKIVELKKYLGRAMEKIKMQDERKANNDRSIQHQLSNTEKFLNKARHNMENILKTRNAQQE